MTAQFREGDRVKVVLGKTIAEGRVVAVCPSRIDVRPERSSTPCYLFNVPTDGTDGWTVEVLPEPEPPARTVVLDYRGFAWQRLLDRWCCIGGTMSPLDSLDALDARRGPLTLLEVAS